MRKNSAEPRRGRRTGQPDTRAQLLDAARKMFIEVGYRRATVRAIAAEASVDPALITYFFGSKQQLFGEALALRTNPADVIAQQIDGPIAEMPRRLLTALLETWDSPENQPSLLAIAQTGAGPEGTALTSGFVEEVLAAPIVNRLMRARVSAEDARTCTALLVTQLVGVIYARYVLAADPVSTLARQVFIDRFTPALDAVVEACTGAVDTR